MVAGAALAAVALVAGGNRLLLDSLTATDSGTRFRACYALARTYDPQTSAEADAVRRLVVSGLPQERTAALEGLLSRRIDGPPTDVVGAVPGLFPQKPGPCEPVANVIDDPLRRIPREDAKEILRRQGWPTSQVECWEKAGVKSEVRTHLERAGKWDRARLELRSPSASASLRPTCVETCFEDLARYAWLGMPMETLLARRRPVTNEVDWWTALLFRALEGAAGDETAMASVAAEVPRIADNTKRRVLLKWLTRLPPGLEVHPALRPVLVNRVRDSDYQTRRHALDMVVSRPEMLDQDGVASALVAALEDDDPEFRIRAAVGLWDLAPLAEGAKTGIRKRLTRETDAVVQGVLILALTR